MTSTSGEVEDPDASTGSGTESDTDPSAGSGTVDEGGSGTVHNGSGIIPTPSDPEDDYPEGGN